MHSSGSFGGGSMNSGSMHNSVPSGGGGSRGK
jgi:hypothetical protein